MVEEAERKEKLYLGLDNKQQEEEGGGKGRDIQGWIIDLW